MNNALFTSDKSELDFCKPNRAGERTRPNKAELAILQNELNTSTVLSCKAMIYAFYVVT